ncbi:hypothetical protein ABE522_06800 [Stenotrophomonas pennii]|uniref:hypothetical protein n=1 Tax=Stenotrophomonas lacuserhaii TaxID=2760084 RepID=UPI0032086B14
MKSKFALMALVCIFIVMSWRLVTQSLVRGDWSGRPSGMELRAANEDLELPENSDVRAQKALSRGTFIGRTAEAKAALTVDVASRHFIDLARRHDWTLRSDRFVAMGRRMIFCNGRLSHDIELSARGRETLIYAGTYWDTDVNSLRYCKDKIAR